MQKIVVIKRNLAGEETWRYSGHVLREEDHAVVLEARFNRDDLPFQGIELKRNDRFVETFYTDRWYNIFEIHDREDDRIKGWYCNISLPAVREAEDAIAYVDLALDLWVRPDGGQVVLDQAEFDALDLDAQVRSQALAALAELKARFNKTKPPA